MSRYTIWELLRPILPRHAGEGRLRGSRPRAKRSSAAAWATARRSASAPARSAPQRGNPYLGRECEDALCRLLDPISETGEWGIVELDGRACLFCKWCSGRISSQRRGSGTVARVAVVLGEGEVHRLRQAIQL